MSDPDPPASDHLRCNRHDGRGWRCKRLVMDGKTLCEIHYVQGRLRSSKRKVPESLKLQRPKSNSKSKRKVPGSPPPVPPDDDADNGGIRANLDRRRTRKRSRPSDESDADDLAEKKTKNKAEELLRVFVKREIERKKKKRKAEQKGKDKKKAGNVASVEAEQSQEEVTRELPYGRMAISPPPAASSIANAASPSVKLGLKATDFRLVNRKFRSKNIERPPISTLKAVPYAGNVRVKDGGGSAGGVRKKCHWCRRIDNVSLSKCLTCKKRFFCSDCIKERSIDAKEVKMRCPVCRGVCECKACLPTRLKDVSSQEVLKKEYKVTKYLSQHYLIGLVLPILERINLEQRMELEMEAKSKAEVPQVEIDVKKQLLCNRCSFSIVDLHRSCPNCSYKLCLSCCRVFPASTLGDTECPSRKKSSSCGGSTHAQKKLLNGTIDSIGNADNDSEARVGSLCCPSLDHGGCGSGLLDMRCCFPMNYTEELEVNAKEVISSHDSPKMLDISLHCSLCSSMARDGLKERGLLEASQRKHPGDNFLYCPSIHDEYEILLPHFQRHWRNSHPVIVHDVVLNFFTWNPIDLFSTYLNMLVAGGENHSEETHGTNCTDWFEVDFSSTESFSGPLVKADVNLTQETLKLKAKLSSTLCQRGFRNHFAEVFDALPIQEYTNPMSGLLNLTAKVDEDSHDPEVSPCMYITCGSAEEVRREELVSALCYCSHDLVNVLVHASDLPFPADQISKVKTLIRMKHAKDRGGCVDHDLENGMVREHSEITEDAGQPDRTVERNPLSTGVCASSNCLETAEDLPVGTARNSPTKATGSESESDSSNVCSGTGDSPEKPDGQTSHLDSETCTVGGVNSYEKPSGMQWDIFRRQDTPKVLEYIQRHSDEFSNPSGLLKEVVDPVLAGNIFLDLVHKMKLKEEFKIEPWTFIQKLGEAVLIPAGCPYQTRNLKSCVNVAVGFVSPENAVECIKLNGKLSNLPADNKVKVSRLEVEKMVISKISKAIKEIRNESIKCSPSEEA